MEINKGLNDDKILVAGVIGIASTVVGEICSWILLSFGIGTYSTYQINSLIVTYNKPSILVGLFLNLIMGGIIGAAVYLTLKKWGHDHIIMVSLGYTLVAWMFIEIIANGVVDKDLIATRVIGGYVNQFISAVIHAVAKGLMLKWFIFNRS
ncbi:hypothetical protein [Clostridium fungisolvens]|uniref:Uncharacterized protein n=1 Tax=Clostridium fungisolvens TaxID=1604897 RepID=A0A6V8SFA7_9CLOT|nr:hypothetical protein [Clostridium fungisolvens]GFP75481.1 hypothetical protein bsdtw1_01561 [Clostridium fungisolvens]